MRYAIGCLAALLAGLAVAATVSARGAADPIVGTWAFGSGRIVVSASGGAFKGELTSGTVKFGNCSAFKAPYTVWPTIAASGTGYAGKYAGKAGEDGGFAAFACTAPQSWPATWEVSGSSLKFCWTGDKGTHCSTGSRSGAPPSSTETGPTSTEKSTPPRPVTYRWRFDARGTPANRSPGKVFITSQFVGSGTVRHSYDRELNVVLRAAGYGRVENRYRPPSLPKGGVSFQISGATRLVTRGRQTTLVLTGRITRSDYPNCRTGGVVITLVDGPTDSATYVICGATIRYITGKPSARERVVVTIS